MAYVYGYYRDLQADEALRMLRDAVTELHIDSSSYEGLTSEAVADSGYLPADMVESRQIFVGPDRWPAGLHPGSATYAAAGAPFAHTFVIVLGTADQPLTARDCGRLREMHHPRLLGLDVGAPLAVPTAPAGPGAASAIVDDATNWLVHDPAFTLAAVVTACDTLPSSQASVILAFG